MPTANRSFNPPQPNMHPQDGSLLRSFVRGDEAAFAAIVERHATLVMGVCQRVLGHAQDAEDAFQAVFLVLAKKGTALQSHPSIAGWLHETARRVSLKLRANSARRLEIERSAARERGETVAAAATGALLNELSVIVDEEVGRLPARFREVILLRQVEDLGRDEVAARLGLTVAQVKDRLEGGRKRLRERLSLRGITFSAASVAAFLSAGTAEAAATTKLVAATCPAATAFAGGKLAAGAVSASALSLAQGILKMMGLQKLSMYAALLVSLFTGGVLVYGALQDNPDRFQRGVCGRVVELHRAAATRTITISLDDFGTLLNLDLSRDVEVWTAFQSDELANVRPGQHVSLRLADDHRTVREVHVEGHRQEATIDAISPSRVLRLAADDDFPDRKPRSVSVAPDAIIRIGDLPATLDELQPGEEVPLEFSADGLTVNAIEAESPDGAVVEGAIAIVDASAGIIKLKFGPDDGDANSQPSYAVTAQTLILRDGQPASVAELSRGELIRLRLAPDGRTVQALHAKSPLDE